ncbi:hypothetical protein L2E82_12436 [Cichorium intybus]|uniref:Uncharacterized protein n=1 Tax=Cichorium intybus TaxID=13427 RepID=A0ACB9GGP6_CICIN|nr:hypothetical protein L2E82_12436 [Cichorium intybus]
MEGDETERKELSEVIVHESIWMAKPSLLEQEVKPWDVLEADEGHSCGSQGSFAIAGDMRRLVVERDAVAGEASNAGEESFDRDGDEPRIGTWGSALA